MRKRWEFNPWPFVVLWVAVGFLAMFVVQGLTGGCSTKYVDECGINGPMSKSAKIEVIVWLGPFMLTAVGWILIVAVPTMAKVLWKARPRRIEEPVTEDLREVEK